MSVLEARTPSELEQLADEKGCSVVYTADNILLLDIDNYDSEKWHHILKMLDILENNGISCIVKESWTSMSGRGKHVVIELSQPLSLHARIALQAAMGSDPVREVLGVIRALSDQVTATVLFKPDTVVKEQVS